MMEEMGYNYDVKFRNKVEGEILGLIILSTEIYKDDTPEDIKAILENHNLIPSDFKNEIYKAVYGAILACYRDNTEPTIMGVVANRPEYYRSNNANLFEMEVSFVHNIAIVNTYGLIHMIFLLKQYVLMDFWNSSAKNILYGNWNGRDVIHVGENIVEEYNQLFSRMTSKLINENIKEEDNYAYEIIEKVSKKALGQTVGVPTTIVSVDSFLQGNFPGELIIIAGRPGMGKTTYALITAWEAYKLGNPVLFISIEMPKNQLKSKIVSLETGIDYLRIKGGDLTPEELQNVLAVNRDIDNSNFFILDKINYIEDISDIVPKYVKDHGVKIVFIDFLQRCKTKSNVKIRERMTDISRDCKSIAKDNYIPVVALSQLSRAVESRQNKRPYLSDLKETGAIEEDADIVAFLFRQSYYDNQNGMPVSIEELFHTEFIVAKGRDIGNRTIHIYLDAIHMKAYDYRFDGDYEVFP